MSNHSVTVHYEVHGRGFPLILGYPIMASGTPDDPRNALLNSYLDLLTDRYRVLAMDYPDRRRNGAHADHSCRRALTAEHVCEDILSVADAAGFEKFIWWGFSWGAVIGLQLAARSKRVAALVCGGWPPLGGPYADLLQAVRTLAANPQPDLPIQPEQFVTFYESVQNWREAEAVRGIRCPRMTFVGSADEVEIGGVIVRVAGTIRERRPELEREGWHVAEIPGRDHSIYQDPSVVVPVVRAFLDAAIR